ERCGVHAVLEIEAVDLGAELCAEPLDLEWRRCGLGQTVGGDVDVHGFRSSAFIVAGVVSGRACSAYSTPKAGPWKLALRRVGHARAHDPEGGKGVDRQRGQV